MDVSLSELRELVMDSEAWRVEINGVAKSRTQLSDWTELTETMNKISLWEYRNEGADNGDAVLVAVMRFSEEKSQSKGLFDLFRDYFFF